MQRTVTPQLLQHFFLECKLQIGLQIQVGVTSKPPKIVPSGHNSTSQQSGSHKSVDGRGCWFGDERTAKIDADIIAFEELGESSLGVVGALIEDGVVVSIVLLAISEILQHEEVHHRTDNWLLQDVDPADKAHRQHQHHYLFVELPL